MYGLIWAIAYHFQFQIIKHYYYHNVENRAINSKQIFKIFKYIHHVNVKLLFQDQYQFCYRAALEYLGSFDNYANWAQNRQRLPDFHSKHWSRVAQKRGQQARPTPRLVKMWSPQYQCSMGLEFPIKYINGCIICTITILGFSCFGGLFGYPAHSIIRTASVPSKRIFFEKQKENVWCHVQAL